MWSLAEYLFEIVVALGSSDKSNSAFIKVKHATLIDVLTSGKQDHLQVLDHVVMAPGIQSNWGPCFRNQGYPRTTGAEQIDIGRRAVSNQT